MDNITRFSLPSQFAVTNIGDVQNTTLGTLELSTENDANNLTSSTNEVNPDVAMLQIIRKIFYTGIIPVIIVFGIGSNILTVVVMCRQKPKSTTVILLMALAFADLFALSTFAGALFLMNARLYYPEFGQKVYILAIPQFMTYIQPLPGRIANLLVAVIAFERMFAVTKPFDIRRYWTKRITVTVVIVMTLIATLLTLPKAFMYDVIEIKTKSGKTQYVPMLTEFGKRSDIFDPYYIFTECVLRFIPISFVLISSIVISTTFCVSNRKRQSIAKVGGKNNNELQLTVTLLTITLVFSVCLLPGTISRLMVMFDPASQQHQLNNLAYNILSIMAFLTESINSSVNFIIYVSTNSRYRIEFLVLCRCFKRR